MENEVSVRGRLIVSDIARGVIPLRELLLGTLMVKPFLVHEELLCGAILLSVYHKHVHCFAVGFLLGRKNPRAESST